LRISADFEVSLLNFILLNPRHPSYQILATPLTVQAFRENATKTPPTIQLIRARCWWHWQHCRLRISPFITWLLLLSTVCRTGYGPNAATVQL